MEAFNNILLQSSANDELVRTMVYEGVSGISDKRGGDQCGWLSIPKSGGLNRKSATISMCKIHNYIDSKSFRQTYWKM